MNHTRFLILNMGLIIFLVNCVSTTFPVSETILDGITHIEDSLIYEIPHSPRLCDAMDVEKQCIDIGDVKLYTEIEGSGTPMVLINGGPGGSHHTFHPWLSQAKGDFQLIYYDQRGCGLSDYEPGQGYSFDQAVDDLDKLREALNIDKWILLGHSYGGGLAQYYTIKHPDRVIGQVLVGSVAMTTVDNVRARREETYYADAEHEKKAELMKLIRSRKISMAQYTYNRDINGGWKRQSFTKPSRERIGGSVLYDYISDKNYVSDWTVYDFEGAFLDCPVPTLIFEGKYDLVWPADRPETMQNYHPNAKLVVFEKSGHNIFADEPAQFVTELQIWSKSIDQASKSELDQWSHSANDLISGNINLIRSSKAFINLVEDSGVEEGLRFYKSFKVESPDTPLFFEAPMNMLGYGLLFDDKANEAVEVFKLNVMEYPNSWNVYDSYAEGLVAIGEKELAIQNYKKSVELNPDNENGVNMIQELASKLD